MNYEIHFNNLQSTVLFEPFSKEYWKNHDRSLWLFKHSTVKATLSLSKVQAGK